MTLAGITIRAGRPDDALTIARLVTALTEEICVRSGTPPFNLDVSETAENCRALIEQGRYLTLLAFAEKTPVGVATISEGCALYVGGALATVQEFYVTPEWRSRRIGAALIERIRELGCDRQWKAVELCTPPLLEFDKTVAFYRRCGFAVVGGRKMRTSL